jgi:hypothetical protein
MGGGDRAGGQLRIAKVLLDEGIDAGQERLLVGVGGDPAVAVQLVSQADGQDLERGGGQPRGLGRTVVLEVPGQLHKELRGQRPHTPDGWRRTSRAQLR